MLLVGKGHTKPRGKCDRWWRKPRGLLKRATRFAYSDDYSKHGGKNYFPYGPVFFDDANLARKMAGDRVFDDDRRAKPSSPPFASTPFGVLVATDALLPKTLRLAAHDLSLIHI